MFITPITGYVISPLLGQPTGSTAGLPSYDLARLATWGFSVGLGLPIITTPTGATTNSGITGSTITNDGQSGANYP